LHSQPEPAMIPSSTYGYRGIMEAARPSRPPPRPETQFPRRRRDSCFPVSPEVIALTGLRTHGARHGRLRLYQVHFVAGLAEPEPLPARARSAPAARRAIPYWVTRVLIRQGSVFPRSGWVEAPPRQSRRLPASCGLFAGFSRGVSWESWGHRRVSSAGYAEMFRV
jgi:hypothetical protein